jgi:hypothetical protein
MGSIKAVNFRPPYSRALVVAHGRLKMYRHVTSRHGACTLHIPGSLQLHFQGDDCRLHIAVDTIREQLRSILCLDLLF